MIIPISIFNGLVGYSVWAKFEPVNIQQIWRSVTPRLDLLRSPWND